jgi:ribonuclease P protein component
VGIPRAYRLRKSRDFERVRASGRSWTNRWLVLAIRANGLDRVRVGITASRRVGGAVVRSRIRRLIREAVRPRLDQIDGGWDMVFIARVAIASASFHEVDRAVTELLQRAGLISETVQ